MSARARAVVITALVAALSAGVVVAIAARSGGEPPPQTEPSQRPGAPPLALDFGVRTDAEARDLRTALGLYENGKRRQAAAIFARHDSLDARVGAAVARWPNGTVPDLSRLAALYPKSGLVQLELGLALFWAGSGGASDAWHQAAVLEPDTSYGVAAGNLLYPSYAKNLPGFVPDQIDQLERLGRGSPATALAALRHWATTGTVAHRLLGHLLYGVMLQRLEHPVSASREFDRAATLAPGDPEALTAAAVGRFDKADPAAAFSRLGPLARRFPRSATVRFHLGLMLIWIGSINQAKKELQLATTVEPRSPLVPTAKRYLAVIAAAHR